jgi:hypothetical protein
MKVLDWAKQQDKGSYGLGFSVLDAGLQAFGFEGLKQRAEAARLDGLLVLWHP